jgi:Glycosyltransferase family 9 (heptosyltransferase)
MRGGRSRIGVRNIMPHSAPGAAFLLGHDYHLGDLLWLTSVLATYRRLRNPSSLAVCLPDRDISRILEYNPAVDHLLYGDSWTAEALSGAGLDPRTSVHDLRPMPIARGMLRDWGHHLPWLYYRDLWLRPRGQWLATYLHLGELTEHRPRLRLVDEDRAPAMELSQSYVVLAPGIGSYSLPILGRVWRKIKTWDRGSWKDLAAAIRRLGMEPITLSAAGQAPIEGTTALLGLPIRQAAAVIERAQALVSVESGLWFVAAALGVPFIIVPWWLPRSLDWPAPMGVPYRLVRREEASVDRVLTCLRELVDHET